MICCCALTGTEACNTCNNNQIKKNINSIPFWTTEISGLKYNPNDKNIEQLHESYLKIIGNLNTHISDLKKHNSELITEINKLKEENNELN